MDRPPDRSPATPSPLRRRPWRRALTLAGVALCNLALLGAAVPSCGTPRLTRQALGDVGTIDVPAGLDAERYLGDDDELMHRVAFQFSSTYLWASMSGRMHHKQAIVVSLMAADAHDDAYAEAPARLRHLLDDPGPVRERPLGTGRLAVVEGTYPVVTESERAVHYLYVDRARRLQIFWHAVKSQHDPATAAAQIERMAASLRLLRDPAPILAERRQAPAREAAERARRLADVRAMLEREGFGPLQPGRAVWRRGASFEWTQDPEPRFQLLVPLGRLRRPGPGTDGWRRPAGGPAAIDGVVWREFSEGHGQWLAAGPDGGAYLSEGIAAELAAHQHDPRYVYFYWSHVVRVDHETDPVRLQTTSWFFDGLATAQRRWRDDPAAGPGRLEADAWPR